MVIENIMGWRSFSPFKNGTIDDKWDQVNRSYVFILFLFMGIVSSLRQYTGGLIACDGFSKFSPQFSEDFCWTLGMYTVEEAYHMPIDMVPYPGIMPSQLPGCLPRMLKNGTRFKCPESSTILPVNKIYHLWYQWASFWFYIVAVAFYIPYIVFKQLGGEDYKPLIRMLKSPLLDHDGMELAVNKTVHWCLLRFKTYMFGKGYNAWWRRNSLSFVFMATKILYLLVVMVVFYATDQMFEYGSFFKYGAEWSGVKFSPLKRNISDYQTYQKDILFPKIVSCEIKRFGASGIETETAQCVLAPNVLNQYLFLIAWFVLVMAFFSNMISCFLHISEMCFVGGTYSRMLDEAMMQDIPKYRYVFKHCGAGGREILQILHENSNPIMFEKIYKMLVNELVDIKGSRKKQGLLISNSSVTDSTKGYSSSSRSSNTYAMGEPMALKVSR